MERMDSSNTNPELVAMLMSRAEMVHDYVRKRIPARFQSVLSSDDVAQEVWVTAFKTFGAFQNDRPDAFDRWLMALASRKLIDAVRRLARTKRGGDARFAQFMGTASTILPLVEKIASDQPTPSSHESAREACHAVHLALARLPDRYRQALTLYYLRGCTRIEVQEAMDVSANDVNNLLSRGLEKLRAILGSSSQYLSGSSSAAGRRGGKKRAKPPV